METINGEWIMMGCAPDDPGCLHTPEELKKLILEIGFLPLFSNGVPGFSVEEHTASGNWWTDDPAKDPWAWRQILAGDPEIAYGKFFDRKVGFVSKAWFPVLANYRRNGYDFDALCGDDLVPYRNRKLMEAFELDEELKGLELLSFEAKQKAGFGKDGQKNFEGALTELQMQAYLIVSGFRQKKNKKGEGYGWHIAALETPETKWGYDCLASGYREEPEESWKRILEQVKRCFPEAEEKAVRKLLGIRYPGETGKEKDGRNKKPEKEKTPRLHEMPYPEGLFAALGLMPPFTDDQTEGLQYVIELLNTREREVLLLRYREHQTLADIAKTYGIAPERTRQILANAVRKLKKPDHKCYYTDGFVNTLARLEGEKEQHLKKLMKTVPEVEKGVLLKTSVYDMGLSARVTNSLIRDGIYTLADFLSLMADNPKRLARIRGLGYAGRAELFKKLEDCGISFS